MEKNRIAVELTETAKGNHFIDSEIHGGVKVAGSGNQFVRTRIHQFKREHPLFYWLGVIAAIITVLTALNSFFAKDTYVGFFYPDASNLMNDVQSPNSFNSLETCRDWVNQQTLMRNLSESEYDYECGKNCDLSGGKPYVCEETLE